MRRRIHDFLIAVVGVTSWAGGHAAEPVVLRNIAYLGVDRTEKGDLYFPGSRLEGQSVPAVLVIHGGGWVGGDKAAAREINICTTLAANGYAAFSINYHLAPRDAALTSWPQNVRDCKDAVRWLRANATLHGLNTARIGVIGSSAGGHLASLLGVTGSTSPFDYLEHSNDDSARVAAVVDLYGPIQLGLGPLDEGSDLTTSPFTYLNTSSPPFLIIHGSKDLTVDVERSREFAAALAQAGVPHELVILDGAPHTFDLEPAQRDLRPLVLEFFNRHLRR